jgi:outer membrane protein
MITLKKAVLAFLLIMLCSFKVFAQDDTLNRNKLSLQQAIDLGIKQNKALQIQQVQRNISAINEVEVTQQRLPDVDFHTSYNRISNLKQFENGITHKPTKHETINSNYDFTLGASIPVYAGGRLKFGEKIAHVNTSIEDLNVKKTARELRMEIITAYMQISHLLSQQNLYKARIKEDSVVINQVRSLSKNGLVTDNEILRTELQLSNHTITMITIKNDIDIVEHQLATLLAMPDGVEMNIDTTGLIAAAVPLPALEQAKQAAINSDEELLIAMKNIDISELERKLARADYLPQIALKGKYFLQYPNLRFFPPDPYNYTMGMIGIDLTFSVSGLFKNKTRVNARKEEIRQSILERDAIKDQLSHNVYEAHKKLAEVQSQTIIAQQAITQARENYRIVRNKYENQLSLITELIDADNSLLEAQSNLISTRVNLQLKYYQLQYIIGNL